MFQDGPHVTAHKPSGAHQKASTVAPAVEQSLAQLYITLHDQLPSAADRERSHIQHNIGHCTEIQGPTESGSANDNWPIWTKSTRPRPVNVQQREANNWQHDSTQQPASDARTTDTDTIRASCQPPPICWTTRATRALNPINSSFTGFLTLSSEYFSTFHHCTC